MVNFVRVVSWCLVLVWSAVASAADGEPVRFDGHRVVRVQLETAEQLDAVLKLTDDVWSEHIGVGPLDVRVSPAQFDALRGLGLDFTILIDNVQAAIDAERAANLRGTTAFTAYMDYPTLVAYMNDLVNLRPDLASIIVVGQTVEGRDILCLRITGPGGGPKPGVIYHGAQHSREWITVPVTLYTADRLIRLYDTDAYIRRLVDRAEWFIFPVMNVDGYIYTWGPNRLWRKNRRDNGDGTFGVDLNRNWGFQWGGQGASASSSSETYRGPSAFSEPETQAMRDFFLARPNLVTHNDIHSYSQLILWPWGYQSPTTPDEPTFRVIGDRMAQIIASFYGTSYDPGAIYNNIYPASGVSVDWTYGARGVLGFSFELRDTGAFGFVLPPEQILPSCIETFPALLHQADATTAAVKIEFPSGVPALLAPGAPTTLPVRITPVRQAVNPAGATLHYRTTTSGAFASVPISLVAGADYLAIFPARACGDPTQFYVTATGDAGGVAFEPATAPTTFYSIQVGSLVNVFDDDFEIDRGWTVQNDPTLTSGAWVRVDPVGTTSGGIPAQPEDDFSPDGTFCYVTGQGVVGGAVGAADVDGGATRLTSPVFDLSAPGSYQLSYARWIYGSAGDSMVVQVSADNGSTWTTIETAIDTGGWEVRSWDLGGLITPTAQVRVRFTVTDGGAGSIVEGAVDEVQISRIECTAVPAPGDLNCDGNLNSLDVEAFALALVNPTEYGASYPGCNIGLGDLNDDTFVNGDDVQPFVAALIGP